MSNQNNDQNQQQNEGGKVEINFTKAMKKMTALMGDGKGVYSSKIENSEIKGLIDSMLKDRKKQIHENFKVEASKVIDEVIATNKFISQKKKEFDEAVLARKKELTGKINGVIGLIEDAAKMERDYYAALNGEATGTAPESENTENNGN